MNPTTIECFLPDVVNGPEETPCKIVLSRDGICIHPKGMGINDGDYAPIRIERAKGKVRVICWPDITSLEAVIVDMSRAIRKKVKKSHPKGKRR